MLLLVFTCFFFLVCELSRFFFVRQVPSAACTWYYTSTLGYSYFWQNLRFEVTWLYGSPSSNFIFLGGPPAAQAGTLKTKALTGPNMCLRPTTGLVGFICTTWNKSAVSRKYTASAHSRGTTGHTQDIWWTGKGPAARSYQMLMSSANYCGKIGLWVQKPNPSTKRLCMFTPKNFSEICCKWLKVIWSYYSAPIYESRSICGPHIKNQTIETKVSLCSHSKILSKSIEIYENDSK